MIPQYRFKTKQHTRTLCEFINCHPLGPVIRLGLRKERKKERKKEINVSDHIQGRESSKGTCPTGPPEAYILRG